MNNERTFDPAKAARLDNPDRLQWLPPGDVVEALGIGQGSVVADIGAGTGYFSIPMARWVGPSGRVFAVDLQPEMLEILRPRLASTPNVVPLHGNAHDTGIDEGACDLVLFANVWHELDDWEEALRESGRILRTGGRVGVLDWRSESEPPPGPPQDHRVSMSAVAGVFVRCGWRLDSTRRIGPYSYLVIAERPRLEQP